MYSTSSMTSWHPSHFTRAALPIMIKGHPYITFNISLLGVSIIDLQWVIRLSKWRKGGLIVTYSYSWKVWEGSNSVVGRGEVGV